jgi:predicted naringenin-chalcone synthase
LLGRDGERHDEKKEDQTQRLVTRIGPAVASLVAELRGHERQAAQELGQWKTHHGERKVIDASPAAVTLGMICT